MAPSHRILAVVALALLPACHPGFDPGAAPAPAAPEAAVQAFLAAVDSNSIDRMAALWGTERGPSTVVIRDREERQRRLVIMQRLLQHEAFEVVSGPAALDLPPGQRKVYVELRRGGRRATVPFTVVAQRAGGWLVLNVGLDAVMPSSTQHPRPSP